MKKPLIVYVDEDGTVFAKRCKFEEFRKVLGFEHLDYKRVNEACFVSTVLKAPGEYHLVFDDLGIYDGLRPNPSLAGVVGPWIMPGPFIVCRVNDCGDIIDMDEEDIRRIRSMPLLEIPKSTC